MGLSFPASSLIGDLAGRKKMLSLQELADLTGVSYKTLWQMAQAGQIPHVRIGAQIRLLPGEMASWLSSHHIG